MKHKGFEDPCKARLKGRSPAQRPQIPSKRVYSDAMAEGVPFKSIGFGKELIGACVMAAVCAEFVEGLEKVTTSWEDFKTLVGIIMFSLLNTKNVYAYKHLHFSRSKFIRSVHLEKPFSLRTCENFQGVERK